MTLIEYVDFFEDLAASHVDIGNGTADGQFLNINLFDSLTDKPSGLKWKEEKYALIVVDPELMDASVNHDQRIWSGDCEFWVVATTGREDAARIREVKNGALAICKQILAKMIEVADDETLPLHWLHGLVDGSWVLTKIGPLWDGAYGYRVMYQVRHDATADLVVDDGKWL